MAQQLINIGTVANDRTGDSWRGAFDKTNQNFTELFDIGTPAKQVIVNDLSDLPAPVSGQITTDSSTRYLLGDDINLGANELKMGDNSVIDGLDENVVSLTYTGTGTMFAAVDVNCRLKGFRAVCVTGTLINASNTAGNEGTNLVVMENVDYQCQNLGNTNNLNAFAMFRCAAQSISGGGLTCTGTQGNVLLIDQPIINISNGSFINLGAASFLSVSLSNYIMFGGAGTTMLTGATLSANIRAGGLGVVTLGRNLGAETPISGVSVDDALWEFDLNNKIRDSRSDALISLQNNATATIISAVSTPVKVAGTWVIEGDSQFSSDTTGRTTYDGFKDARLPTGYSLSVEPVSGTNVTISAFVAINGVVVANSRRPGTASAGQPASITIPWQITYSQGDYVEAFVQNDSNTTNILVSSGVGRTN